MVRTGISGSQTVAATSQAFCLGGVALGGLAALGGFRIGHVHFHGAYQLAPGYSRASTCISARR